MGKNMFDLTGKVALITGGGSGIGRAYCEAMAEFGADVVCADINELTAQETVRLINKFGHRAIAIKVDASQEKEVGDLVKHTILEFGKLDIVFCNAGVGGRNVILHEQTTEDWDKILSINLKGVFYLMKASIIEMLNQKINGSIINTSSIAGLYAGGEGKFIENLAVYGSAKAGVIQLTRWAAVTYAKYGIRINSISPGYIRTNIQKPDKVKEYTEVMVRNTPMRRQGLPDDIKGTAIWLASDASAFVTGQTIIVDGGIVL